MNISRSNVSRSARHVKSVAAVLAAALLATSSWLVLRADVPQVASGTWAPAGDVGAIPSGAASVALPDGRMLVAGGTIAGALSNGIATYDPAAGAWASGGNLVVPRSGHAAALLKDGRVLFAGGTAAEGPSFDIEIYDPATGVSAHAGDMTLARVDHAAATLRDGRVLIVGGFDGQSPLNLGEIFDPATGQSTGAAAAMSTGRVKATATTLLDGHVLVAGGNDGTQDLASAEIFDAASGAFFATGAMQTARSGHVAVLLPSNNQVLIAGGMAAGAAVASAELYADWSDGFSNTPNPMSAARAGGIAAGLLPHDLALVAGGGSTSGEFFGYATVKTDRTDYWPGEPVTVTGSGWQPGETVTLVISEDADTHYDFTYSAVADASGAITNAEFAPIENEVFHHFGKKFYVAARGAASAALNTFTDGNVKVAVSPASHSANTAGHLFTVEEFTTTACTGTPTGTSTVGVAAGKTENIGGTGTSTRITAPSTDDQGTAFSGWFNTAGYVAVGQAVCVTSSSSGSQTITAVYGGVTKIAFTNSPINALAGTCNAMGLQTQNASGAATAPFASTAAQLTTTAASGAFYSNSSCTSVITSTTITTASANSPVFYYKDTAAGTPTVTADPSSTTSLAAITQLETITAACTVPAGVSITPNGAVSKSVGDSLTFTASVTAGTPALHYGWTKDGTPIVGAPDNASYTISPVALTDAGTYRVVVSNGCSTGVTSDDNAVVSVNRVATALAVGAASGTYGGNTSAPLTATLTAGGNGVNGKVISFTLNGTSVGTATTNSSGVATLASASSLTGINAGSYAAGVAASFAQDGTYAGQTASNSLTVNSVQLSVKADDKSKTYDGAVFTAFTSSISGFVNGETESGLRGSGALTGAAAYSGAATTAVSASATPYPITPAVGTLTATNYTFTFVNGNLTINKKAATVTANAKSKFYGDANPDLDAAVTGTVGTETLDYTLTTTALATSGVGPYPIVVTLGTNPNYAVTKTDATLTVNPKAATVTANAKSKFYGDANPTLDAVVTGTVGTETLDYSLTTTALATSGVGPYPIVVTLGTNPNYAVTKTDATLTVNPKAATVTANAKSKFYGDANPTLDAVVTGTVGTETLDYSLTTTALATSGVGPYPIVVTLGTNPNYAVTKTDATLTVNPKAATVTANAKSKFYGDANPTLDAVVTGTVGTETLDYSLTTTALATSGVGPYPIVVTLGTNPNYAVTKTDATLTVNPKAATVTANAKSKFYGDANPDLDAVVTGTVGTETLDYTLTTTALATSGVGPYPIVVTLGTNPNYAVTKTDATLTVNPKAATVTANAKSKFYGDANPDLDAVVTGTVGTETLDYSLTTTALATSGVGPYPIVVTLGTNPNYAVTKTDATLTVNPKAATVTANAKSKFYGDANPDLDAVVTGTVGTETLDYTLTTTALATSGVGPYPIVVTLGTNPNYAVTKTDATLTVNPKAATVTANAKSKFYGDANPTLDAVVTGTVGTETLDYSLTTTALATSGVGPYPIVVTLGTNPNYAVTKTDATLTVNPKAATVTANAKSKFYGDANPTLDAVVTGTVGTETLDYSLTTTALATSGVGPYPIVVTLGTNPNYAVTKTDATLTVNPKAATVTANAKSKFYGDANPTLDAVVTGTVGTETLDYSLTTTALATSGVGPYPIVVTLGTNPNYAVTPANGTLTVNPKAATVTANAKSKFYGDPNPTLDGVVTGTVGTETLNYTLTTTALATSGVGPYPIVVTLGSNPNYAVTPANGTLTVNKATLKVTADNKTKLLNAANPTLTASYDGFVNGETLATSGLTGAPGLTTTALVNSPVGQYPITAAQGTLTSANYAFVYANGTLTVLYEWDGFLQPINDTAHDLGIMSRFKAGQTIPAKFDLKDANGVTVTQAVNPMFGFALIGASCGTSAPDSIDFPEPPSSVPVYTLNGGHYQYNWSTKGVAVGLYRIFAKLNDGTTQSVDICLSK